MSDIKTLAMMEMLACMKRAQDAYVRMCAEKGINFSNRDTTESRVFTEISKAQGWAESLLKVHP